jgi:hypothetical protein
MSFVEQEATIMVLKCRSLLPVVIIFTITGGNGICPIDATASEMDSYTLIRQVEVRVNN